MTLLNIDYLRKNKSALDLFTGELSCVLLLSANTHPTIGKESSKVPMFPGLGLQLGEMNTIGRLICVNRISDQHRVLGSVPVSPTGFFMDPPYFSCLWSANSLRDTAAAKEVGVFTGETTAYNLLYELCCWLFLQKFYKTTARKTQTQPIHARQPTNTQLGKFSHCCGIKH